MDRGLRTGARPRQPAARFGKSDGPDGADSGGLAPPPPVATGDEADEIIDQARRQTVPRRTLERQELFGQISPNVGEIDEDALADAMEEDPDEALSLIGELTGATDVELRKLARAMAGRLFLDLAKESKADGRGVGRIVTAKYRPGESGDIDIDASIDGLMEARAGRRIVESADLRVQTWKDPSTAWCLLIDRSGSMNGKPLATAALSAALVAARSPGEYAVLSFGQDVVAPKAMWEVRSPDDVIDRVLALRGHGTTDVEQALWAAYDQLNRSAARRRVTVLLSDCRSTEVCDAARAAAALDELLIIAPEGDSSDAAQLAGSCGGRWTTVAGPSTAIEAFDRVLR